MEQITMMVLKTRSNKTEMNQTTTTMQEYMIITIMNLKYWMIIPMSVQVWTQE